VYGNTGEKRIGGENVIVRADYLRSLLNREGKYYVKRPVPVLAVQVDDDFIIDTLEGTLIGKKGDYLVMGVKGELYPVKKDIFEQTYVPVKGKPEERR